MKLSRLLFAVTFFVAFIAFAYFITPDFFRLFDSEANFLYFFNKGNRMGHLYDAVRAHQDHGPDLIRYVDFVDANGLQSKIVVPMETTGDDLGMYYFVPKLLDFFPVLSYLQGYYIVFSSIIILGFILAVQGFNLLFVKTKDFVLATLAYSLLSFICFYAMDVYVAAFLACSIIPISLYFFCKKPSLVSTFVFVFFGALLAVCTYFRAHSSTGVVFFLFIAFITVSGEGKGLKLLSTIIPFILGVAMWSLYSSSIINKRNDQLMSDKYDNRLLEGFQSSHIFWHGAYLGLGYQSNNKYRIKWQDQYGYKVANNYAKAHSELNLPRFTPLNMTEEYEDILKGEYMDILKNDIGFIFKTYSLKFLRLLIFIFPFLLLGFVVFKFNMRGSKQLWLPAGLSILFYCLPGVIVWPHAIYVTGAITIGLLLGILSRVDWKNNKLT